MRMNLDDNDIRKGAVEPEQAEPEKPPLGMQGQLGHRDEDAMIKDNDTDFPEPGSSPEHSGQKGRAAG